MQRWKLTIEYDGTPFAGWQRQDNAFTVQQCLEDAVFAFSGEKVRAHVAGRTDAGVHAIGQVAHIDLARVSDPKTVRDAINYHMRPHPAAVLVAEPAGDDFHARLTARHRVYCYKMLANRRADSITDAQRTWHVGRTMDIDAMNAAAKYLIGIHDFSSFRASECQANSPVRGLDRLEFIVNPSPLSFGTHIEMWAEAKSFLHHQIRNIAGTLEQVGQGKWTPEKVRDILEARDRTQAGQMAPAHGLYFVRVDY